MIGIIILANTISLYSQIFIPVEFQNAVKNGFRTTIGQPGEKYFVNTADYEMDVFFDPDSALLKANERIVYHNNSPDTLKTIVFHIVQNYLKKGTRRDFTVNPDDLHEGIQMKNVMINGQEYEGSLAASGVVSMTLPEPLPPGSQMEIAFDWSYHYPQKTKIRMGKYDEGTFFVGHWFPQIAVYDDVYGWDKIPHTGWQEFYNDHCNYKVSITVPAPNVIWATGRLQNPEEVFTDKIAKRYAQALHSTEVVHIITSEDKNILRNDKENTFVFEARQVPDFSFATSGFYYWDALTVKQKGGDDVLVAAAYQPREGQFDDMARLTADVITSFASDIPGIPFPYPSMTIFNGGGAMEYPMMVNLWQFKEKCGKAYVVAHEVGHTYFPFAAGTNETMYAWMDEGLINYFPRYPASRLADSCKLFENMVRNYKRAAGTQNDIPVSVPSAFIHNAVPFRHIAYNRPAFAFYELTRMVGEKAFFSALKDFYDTWKGKHPYPPDFFHSFNQSLNQNLDWFWKPYFEEFVYPDLTIVNAQARNGMLDIEIENTGGLPVTVLISVEKQNGETLKFTETAEVWKDKKKISLHYKVENPKKIILGDELHPDIYPEGNEWFIPN